MSRAAEDQQVPERKKTTTVLVVDDEDLVRKLVCEMLKRGGFKVLEADNAAKALELCRDKKSEIDLVLTDIVMPNTDGFQLAYGIYQLYPNIRIMFMTGHCHIEQPPHKKISLISKPFDQHKLFTEIKKLFPRE
jgi:DNA-binding NtrC family response regulator